MPDATPTPDRLCERQRNAADRRELNVIRRDMGAVQAERDDYCDAAETAQEDARVMRRDRDILATRLEKAEQARDALQRVQTLTDAMRKVPGTRAWADRLEAAIRGTSPRVGTRIHQLRTAQGRSLTELAVAAAMTRETIRNIETGKTTPLPSSLDALAEALGVPRAALDRKETP